MRRLLGLLLLIGLLSYALAQPTTLVAAPWSQSNTATLRLENQSDQAISVCNVFAFLLKPYKVVLNIEEQITLAPGANTSFALPPGQYHLLVFDCVRHPMFKKSVTLIDSYVVPLKNQAATHITPSTPNDPVAQCARGVQLLMQGKSSEARLLLEAGFAERVRTTFARPSDLGVCAMMLGVLRATTSDYSDALTAFTVGQAAFQQSGDQAMEGMALLSIGKAYTDQGQYAKALESYQQALTIQQHISDREMQGTTLNNIGSVYAAQGQYANALNNYQQALTIARAMGDRAVEGTTLNNIGDVYFSQGRYAEALEHYQQGRAIHQALGDRTHEGITLNNIGLVYAAQGQYANALNNYQQALTIARAIGDHAREGAPFNNMGEVYRNERQYGQALDNFQQALTIARTLRNRAGEIATLNNIGLVYYAQGQYAKALDMYQQAMTIAQELGDQTGEGMMLNNIGLVYHVQGQYAKSLNNYQQAMKVLESVRAVAGSEQGRSGFIAQYASLYSNATALYHRQSQDDMAFATSERGRARAFLDSLATGVVQLSDADAEALLTREQETYVLRQTTQDKLARARAATPPDPKLVANLEQHLKNAEQQHAAALTAIEQRGGQLTTLAPSRKNVVLTLPEVQQRLDAQTTLIAYDVLSDQTLAFIITHDHFQTVAISVTSTALITQIKTLREFADLSEAHPASAVKLYNWLITPLKPYLPTQPAAHLVIIPHSVLHYLPFAALTDGKRFLIQDYTLSTLPSASMLQFIQPHPGITNTMPLIVGDPATTERPPLDPLPNAEQEAQALAKQYGVTPLLGAAATTTAVHERATHANILHLAAHGSYNFHDPLDSTIYLAPSATVTATRDFTSTSQLTDTGHLTVRDLYGWQLSNTSLVMLTACDTQINELDEHNVVSPGDEVVSFPRAFFFAGASTVIATLWSVDDQPTAQLTQRFYTYLQQGRGKAAALRQAQLDTLKDHPNPYYWAAFVLSGDAGPLNATPSKGTH